MREAILGTLRERKDFSPDIGAIGNRVIYPELSSDCTAMLFHNLIDPEWITVSCNLSIAKDILCSISAVNNNLSTLPDNTAEKYVCEKGFVLNNNTCYKFHSNTENICPPLRRVPRRPNDFANFQFLFMAVNTPLMPVLTADKTHLLTYSKYKNIVKYDKSKNLNDKEALIVCEEETHALSVHGHIISCNNSFVSLFGLCDGFSDCAGTSQDEVGCECENSIRWSKQCKHVRTRLGMQCSEWYYTRHDGTCELYTDENISLQKTTRGQKSALCSHGVLKDRTIVNDLVPDCRNGSHDEPILKLVVQNDMFFTCSNGGHIPCRKGHSRCFEVDEICIYKLNNFGHLLPCRTGEHLQICIEFECNMMFKCPQQYCIPWRYVCDGNWDCPSGTDEKLCSHNCSFMFACKISELCVHLGDVCNQETDCPLGDDEILCSLCKLTCPPSCDCLAFAVSCRRTDISLFVLTSIISYRAVFIEEATVSFSGLAKSFPKSFRVLVVTNTNLKDICSLMFDVFKIMTVDASTNQIKVLFYGCFRNLPHLKVVKLNSNKIDSVVKDALVDLISLSMLNLSSNHLLRISIEAVQNSPILKILSLMNNSFTEITTDIFKNLTLQLLETDDFHLCCLKPRKALCSTQIPWYFSCESLFVLKTMKVFLSFTSGSIFIFNIVCMFLQSISMRMTKKLGAFGTIVLSINLANLFLAVYLSTLFIADIHYKGEFMIQENAWRSSEICFLICGVVVLFSFLSPLLMCLLSLSRLEVVINPLHTKANNPKLSLKKITCIYIMSSLLSVIFLCTLWTETRAVPMFLCSPFVDPLNSVVSIEVVTFVTVVFQSGAVCFIIYAYVNLIMSYLASQRQVKSNVKREQYLGMFLQIIFMTGSNVLCYIPSGIVYVVSVSLERFPIDMVVWTTIAVVPINSLMSPVICSTTMLKQRKVWKQ